MVKLICLANSRKQSGRCLAGIDCQTGEWIRPVTMLDTGHIPPHLATIANQPIRLLEVIDIPLKETGQGYECENRTIASKHWQRVGLVTAAEIYPHCEADILHHHDDTWLQAVPHDYLLTLPFPQRRTLQVIQTTDFQVWRGAAQKWRGVIPLGPERQLVAPITDLEICRKLEAGTPIDRHCLIVLSLSQPWRKPDSTETPHCYRLIAGVVELNGSCLND